MLVLGACTEEVKTPRETLDGDENAITLSFVTEGTAISTRAGEISDGSLVNRLYYAIYKKTNDGYVIDDYYHSDSEKYKVVSYKPAERSNFIVKLIPDPETPDAEYKIVCWAQWEEEKTDPATRSTTYSSPYYLFEDLENIEVLYKKNDNNVSTSINYNNDEKRDAFYASESFKASQKGSKITVELTRPFAQLNIGTSGWDYEGIAKIEPEPQIIKYSMVKITGPVATKLNLVENKTTGTDIEELTYEFAAIPAYFNLDNNVLTSDKITGIYATDHSKDGGVFTDKIHEEFLILDLKDQIPPKPEGVEDKNFGSNGYADYISWNQYDKWCAESGAHEKLIYNIFTETFKYLSMCYVLVPFSTDDEGFHSGNTYSVEFDCSTGENGNLTGIYSNRENVFKLNNVPACCNHRTNIITTDGTGFFMNSNEMRVKIYSESYKDYYKRAEAEDDEWNDDSHGGNYGEKDKDYTWPDEDFNHDDDVHLDFDFTLQPVSIGTDIEWNPLKAPNWESKNLDFYIDLFEDNDTKKDENALREEKLEKANKYNYKAWIFLDDKEKFLNSEIINAAPTEQGKPDHRGEIKVSVPQNLFQTMLKRGIRNTSYYLQVFDVESGKPVSSIKNSKISIDMQIEAKSWIFAGGNDDNLGGAKFFKDFQAMNKDSDLYTKNLLTASSGEKEIKKGENCLILNNTGDREKKDCCLFFTIYSSCKVSVSLRKNADQERWIKIDWTDNLEMTKPDLKSTDYIGTAEVNLSEDEKLTGKTVYIYGGGNNGASQNLYSIQLVNIE